MEAVFGKWRSSISWIVSIFSTPLAALMEMKLFRVTMFEEGIVKLTIERVSEFVRDQDPKTQQRLSTPILINGLSWKILAYPTSFEGGVAKHLGFFLQCNGEDDDPNWSCKASAELRIVSQKARVPDESSRFDHKFVPKQISWGFPKFISCDELLAPENCFIKDDVVILRAHVKAEMSESAQMSKLREFSSSISEPPDGTLILGTDKIPIHKMYLSYYSEYFKAMFQSQFIEGHQDEIVIEEVEYVDMLQLLYVIYPSSAPITDKNLKVILKLADRFIMPAVLEQCKKQLKISKLNDAQKLLLAQRYNFKDLLEEFAQQCKTVADAKRLKSEPEYEMLDSETRLLVLDSIAS